LPVFDHPDQEPTLAGQPQDPSWTQSGQAYSQQPPGDGTQQGYQYPDQQQYAEPAPQQYAQPGQPYEQQGSYEQQPSYEQAPYEQQNYQQAPAYDQHQVPSYGQPSGYEVPSAPQAYEQGPAGYEQQGQAGPGQQGHGYPGYDQTRVPGAPGQQPREQGTDHTQWQLPPLGAKPAQPRPKSHERGFIGSLFDFGFTSFVTPKIIKVLYVLVTIWTVIWALAFLDIGFRTGGVAGGLATLIIVDPLLILVSLGVFRVVLEFFMVTFRMQEDLRSLRESAAAGNREGSDPDRVGDGA
jgi:uncharacterized membrane protein